MTSAKQVEANKKNAQHSSGPVSAPGRKKAALNSLTHGLTAQTIVLPEHEKEPYRLYSEGIVKDLAPVGTYEAALVATIIDARWRIHQIASMEAALYSVGFVTHAHEFQLGSTEEVAAMCRLMTFEEKRKEIDRLHRYESRLIRQVAKDTQLLVQAQTVRQKQEEKEEKDQEQQEQEAKNGQEKRDSADLVGATRVAENGFVLSNAKTNVQPINKTSPSAMP